MRKLYFINFQAKTFLPILLIGSLLTGWPVATKAQKKSKDENRFTASLVRQQQNKAEVLVLAEGAANLRTSATTISKPGTEKIYYADTSGWVLGQTINYTYDALGRTTVQLEKGDDGVNNRTKLIAYDTHGNATEELYYYWSGSRWEISSGYQSAYTYNTNGQITEVLEKVMENGSWVNDRKRTYTYNTSGAILTEESQSWNGIFWLPRWRDVFSYSGTALTGIMFLYANDTTGVLENDGRIVDIVWQSTSNNNPYGYPDGELISYTEQTWENGNWLNDEKYMATYGQNGNYVAIEQEWQDTAWVNDNRSTVSFDAQGNETLWEYQQWKNGTWIMEDGSKNTYTYNTSGQMTENINQSWNKASSRYENSYRSVYSNFQTITAAPEEAPALNTEVYPNPTSDKISIRIAPSASTVFVTLTDITGKTILTKQLPATALQHELSLSAFPAGLYMLQLKSGDLLTTKKIIKQ